MVASGSGSGLGAADEVGVGVDAALEIGFVGDLEPPAELERAADGPPVAPPGAGPIFRGARPTGGALVDMTAAIVFVPFSCPCLTSLVLVCLAFFCWGRRASVLIRWIVERWVGWNAAACNGRGPG